MYCSRVKKLCLLVMAFFRWFVSVCFSFLFDTCYALATSVVCTVSYSHLLTLLFTLNILWQTSQHPLKGVATQNVLPLFTFGITDIHSVFHKRSPWSFLQKVQAWQFSHAWHAVLRIMGSAWIWLNLILLASNDHVAFLMSHWKKKYIALWMQQFATVIRACRDFWPSCF